MKQVNAKNKAVLLIGDSHLPYEHIDYLDFVKAVSEKYSCKVHIHMGDYEDNHAISFHKSDHELFSAGDELESVILKTEEWNKAFPKLLMLDSNHGSLVFRRLKHDGIPLTYLKPLKEIYNTPKWTWYEDILLKTALGDVYLCHGKSGMYNKLAKEIGCSAAQGHFHGKFEITWSNSVFHQRFNMFVGCGINRKSMAFAYGKNNIPQPMLGCGVILENGMPLLVKMTLNAKGRWTKKL